MSSARRYDSIWITVTLWTWLGLVPGFAYASDPSPDVPLNHEVYRTLDRFQARGWIEQPLSDIRPYSRQQVAKLLLEILSGFYTDLTKTESGLLRRHRNEFARELRILGDELDIESGGVIRRMKSGGSLYAWQDSLASVSLDPLIRQGYLDFRGNGPRVERVSLTYLGGIVRGTFNDHFGFRIRHFEAREWSTGGRLSRDDVVARPIEDVQPKGRFVDFREAAFQLVAATRWFRLDVGKGTMDWGPGRTGNLLLTSFSPTFGYLRFRASYGRLTYVHIAGSLRARETAVDPNQIFVDNGHVRTQLRSKRLAAHRMEIALSRRVSLGIQEAVIYGDRDFELLYVTPVTLFTAVQNYLGNRDNLVIGLDLSARLGNGIQGYIATFFDDLQKFSPGAVTNKFAIQAGVLWVDPLGVPDSDLRAEYVRVEPFVYSHNFQINTFEHFDALLGFPSGPNSDRLFAQIQHRISPSIVLRLGITRERQGENFQDASGEFVNVGGDAFLGRRPADPRVRDFMSGEVETRTRLGGGIAFEPICDFIFDLEYESTRASNIMFPDGRRRDGSTHLWSFHLDYNFF